MSSHAPTLSSFASISLGCTDKLRLHQFPPSIQDSVAEQIRASWPRGIQVEQAYGQHGYEFKLRGNPFGSVGAKEGVGGRRLVRDLLACLYARGWTLVAPVSHSRQKGSKDSLVFRQRRAEERSGGDVVVPPKVEWLVIAPTGRDRLRVIPDGPIWSDVVSRSGFSVAEELAELAADYGKAGSFSSSSAPPPGEGNHDEFGVLVQSLKQMLAGLDCFQSGEWSHDSFEFKLKGFPWSARDEKAAKVELLLLAVVETLDRFGWRSYATVRQRSDTDEARKQDTWYFVREEGWIPGSPFNAELSSLAFGS